MNAIIRIESLGKRYRIGPRPRYLALRDRLAETLGAPARLFRHARGNPVRGSGEIWALREVSFCVQAGEIVGMIGRNGAGKTTLLKILSRITEPSAGWADIRGSLGSLLEVGSGFHPELTGLENIYLNGAILGMGRREIARKFDEIVDFAEVGQFLDTPLKHYSSGMQTRLAFAVAAHLEPEILLVDEVLAVGDLAFQKKCLGKMDEVARGGRTIIFVSHQMNQIRRLCGRVIWMDQGRLRADGPVAQVVASYESAMARGEHSERQGKDFEQKTRFVRWHIGGGSEINAYQLESFGEVTVHFDLHLEHAIQHGHHGIALFNTNRELIWGRAIDNLRIEPGLHRISYTFPSLPLRPGPYFWRLSLWNEDELIDSWDCSPEMIVATPNFQHPRDEWSGVLNIYSEVSLHPLAEELRHADEIARAYRMGAGSTA